MTSKSSRQLALSVDVEWRNISGEGPQGDVAEIPQAMAVADQRVFSFITEPDGQTTSLVLHQYGIDMPMKRIDAAAAKQIVSFRAEQRHRSMANRRDVIIFR